MNGLELNAPFTEGVNQQAPKPPIMTIRGLNVSYGDVHAVRGVDLDVFDKEILTLIGPSGSGKSTLLMCLNRMHETSDNPPKVSGEVLLQGEDIHHPNVPIILLRQRVGIVFQEANPFPKSVYDNVVFGPRLQNPTISKADMDVIVEDSLTKVALWDEVKDNLSGAGTQLSGGQKQRLCIARALANQPKVLLMDEPCSALDWISTEKVEETLDHLRKEIPIIIVTHNMQQASRIGQKTAFMYSGVLDAYGATQKFFTTPPTPKSEGYITGRYG